MVIKNVLWISFLDRKQTHTSCDIKSIIKIGLVFTIIMVETRFIEIICLIESKHTSCDMKKV